MPEPENPSFQRLFPRGCGWKISRMNDSPEAARRIDPKAAQEPGADFWGRLADDYEAMFAGFSAAVAAVALDALRPRPGDHLLDLAAGTGSFTVRARRAGVRVTAVDRSPGMLRRLEAKCRGDADVETRVMDGMALAFADATFDCAASNLAVILFDDPMQGLREMRRVLRAGAGAVVTAMATPRESTLWRTIFRALGSVGATPAAAPLPFEARSHRDGLRTALNEAGFRDVHVETASVPWMVHDPSEFWRRWGPAVAPPVAAAVAAIPREKLEAAGAAFVRLVEEAHGTGPATFATDVLIAVGTC